MLSPPVGTDVSAVVGKNSRKNHYLSENRTNTPCFRVTTANPSDGGKKVYRHDRIRGVRCPVFCQKAAPGQSLFLLGGPVRIHLLAAGPLKNRSLWDGHAKIRLLSGDHEKSLLSGGHDGNPFCRDGPHRRRKGGRASKSASPCPGTVFPVIDRSKHLFFSPESSIAAASF